MGRRRQRQNRWRPCPPPRDAARRKEEGEDKEEGEGTAGGELEQVSSLGLSHSSPHPP
jgi:hypothetical protein